MFRIRRIVDDVLPIDRRQIEQVQSILRRQFPGVREQEIAGLPDKLKNPLKYGFRALLYVADDVRGNPVRGFALLSHDAQLKFCFLDYIATGEKLTGGGVGGALYERVRDEAHGLGVQGLYFECAPDDPRVVGDPAILKANSARLRFYERYGARPITNTAYETPVTPGDPAVPYLVYDDLGRNAPPRCDVLRKVVRAILERKYAHLCSPAYVQTVVSSIRDHPVRLREPRYIRPDRRAAHRPLLARHPSIPLVVNDKHDIHHVRERGYVEAPVRIAAIRKVIESTGWFRHQSPREYPESHIRAVHESQYIDYFKKVCAGLPPGKSVYPYVFPVRNQARPPKELSVAAGYYCLDTFTPLNHNAYLAAKRAVDCTLTAADALLKGDRIAYALVRPPGHHAEYRAFGGFCYFNNCAVAAHYFSHHGRVAILDIDYHHGNGQQVIFYERADVLTLSIHGHPEFAYPYFSGFEEEKGAVTGAGFNANYPLPEVVDGIRYRATLEKALARVRRHAPAFLIVALGLDTAKGDPTGTWTLTPRDLEENGRLIASLRLPTLVVQEGGYRTRTLGANCRSFFAGLADHS